MTTFSINQPVTMEETRFCEFKEIKGTNPINSIKNTCDEYVVSFLNSNGGSIFWGIRDNDRIVVGVVVNYQERDELRKEVVNKISAIKPAISPNAYQINFHEIVNEEQCVIENCFVIEIVVPKPLKNALYSTGSNDVFVKTDSGKKKLSIPEIEDEILRRVQPPRKIQTEIWDLQVGIGDGFGYNNEIILGFQSFYEDVDITDMFVQIDELFVSKFSGNEFYEKSKALNRSEIFFDSAHIGKSLKWIKSDGSGERISLKPSESAHVLFLENVPDYEILQFGFDAINPNEARKKVWRKDGTYEVYVNVFGKIHNEITYRKRTFIVLIKFIKGSVIEIENSFSNQ